MWHNRSMEHQSLKYFAFSILVSSLTTGCGFARSVSSPANSDDESAVEKHRVFVSSLVSEADFGSVAAADAICVSLATTAGLGGSWKAWLSDGSTDAISHIADRAPWYTPDESTVVVQDYADLSTSGATININKDENGATVTAGAAVWTATSATGLKTAPYHCSNWTSNGDSGGVGDSTWVGEVGGAGAAWTYGQASDCGQSFGTARIYCFEQ